MWAESKMKALFQQLKSALCAAPLIPFGFGGRRKRKRFEFRRVLAGEFRILPSDRTSEDWKRLRKLTSLDVKRSLEAGLPTPAIRRLTRALLEDPAHPLYLDLLRQAVAMKRRRGKGDAGRADSWSECAPDLGQASLQLEAFVAYVQEVEALFAKSAIAAVAPLQGRSAKTRS